MELMEYSREVASKAMQIAENKLQNNDFARALNLARKAQQMFPEIENISQLLAICEVHCSAKKKLHGTKMNWCAILQIEEMDVNEATIKKQFRKLALLLHPDRNKFSNAGAALNLVSNAKAELEVLAKKSHFDVKYEDNSDTRSFAKFSGATIRRKKDKGCGFVGSEKHNVTNINGVNNTAGAPVENKDHEHGFSGVVEHGANVCTSNHVHSHEAKTLRNKNVKRERNLVSESSDESYNSLNWSATKGACSQENVDYISKLSRGCHFRIPSMKKQNVSQKEFFPDDSYVAYLSSLGRSWERKPSAVSEAKQRPNSKSEKSHFYTLISEANLDHGVLMIPHTFTQKYGEFLQDCMYVCVPSGDKWLIKLKKKDDNIFLWDGWAAFATFYFVQPNYWLVFGYEGDSTFTVIICNSRFSEIEYPKMESNFGSLGCTKKRSNMKYSGYTPKVEGNCSKHYKRRCQRVENRSCSKGAINNQHKKLQELYLELYEKA